MCVADRMVLGFAAGTFGAEAGAGPQYISAEFNKGLSRVGTGTSAYTGAVYTFQRTCGALGG